MNIDSKNGRIGAERDRERGDGDVAQNKAQVFILDEADACHFTGLFKA